MTVYSPEHGVGSSLPERDPGRGDPGRGDPQLFWDDDDGVKGYRDPSGTGESDPGPARTAAPNRFAVRVIVLQVLCAVALAATGRLATAVLVTAAMFPVNVALSLVTFRSRPLAAWLVTWLDWRRRRRQARAVSVEGDPVNPLWLLDRQISIGTIRGFRQSELGVLQIGESWVSAVWVTDGPRPPDERAADGLTTLLSLPASPAPGTSLHAVLQQTTTMADGYPNVQMTAWLVIRTEPLAALAPTEAISCVPRLLREEIRRLLKITSHGTLSLLPLDRSDLLSALAATTEVPLDSSPTAVEEVSESWDYWQARGRFHHSFVLDPDEDHSLPLLTALAMDVAADSDAVLTISVPLGQLDYRNPASLPSVRVSHYHPESVGALVDEIVYALNSQGASTHALSGRQGPALLDTSILTGRPRR